MIHCRRRRSEGTLSSDGNSNTAPWLRGVSHAMVMDAAKRWTLQAALIARIFLASTLLLNACTLIFEPGSWTKLISVVELLLGMAVAEGWRLRFTAGLVLAGALSTSLRSMWLHGTFAGSQVLVPIALIIPSSVLLCFGRNDGVGSSLVMQDNRRPSSLDSSAASAIFRATEVEITVRLENGLLGRLRQPRCVVTFHDLSWGAHKTGKEAWYARENR